MNLVNFVDKFGIAMSKIFKYVINDKRQRKNFIYDEEGNKINDLFSGKYEIHKNGTVKFYAPDSDDEEELEYGETFVSSFDLGNFFLSSLDVKYNVDVKNKASKLVFNKEIDIIPNCLYLFNFNTREDSLFVVLITDKERAHLRIVGDTGNDIFQNDYTIGNFKYLWKTYLETLNLVKEKEDYDQETFEDFIRDLSATAFQVSLDEFKEIDTFRRIDKIDANERVIIEKLIYNFKSVNYVFEGRDDEDSYNDIVNDMENFYAQIPKPKRGWFF